MSDQGSQGMSRSAFEESAARAYPVVLGRVSARLHDPQLAEEVSVDSLAQAFEKWRADPAYFRTHDLAAWSSRLAAWRALDRLRERGRFRPLPDDSGRDGTDVAAAARPRRENLTAEADHDRAVVWGCIQQLPAEEQAVVTGYYFGGRTDEELGAELFGPAGSPQARGLRAWRRRHRAHARLRELLIAGGIDPADWGGAGGQAV
jgi:DNA-directed RNA polymerase specialized sigma24 family protein